MTLPRKLAFRFVGAAILLGIVPLLTATAGTLHGTVKNGTTGKVAPGVEVVLMQLQGTMQPVANTQSDAQGQFTFDNAGIGAQPMLVRAVYRGVNFHQSLPPGRTEIEVQIFDSTQNPKTITAPSRVVIFQPNGSSLLVGEEYSIQNSSQPPQAYFRADGNFEFALPENARLQQVVAWGPSGMPVAQADLERGKNRHAIAFAFRPGESGVRYSYELAYPNNLATVKIPVNYPGRLIFVAPPSVEVSGEGINPAGQEQGMSIYSVPNASTAASITVKLSGTAPPPSSANAGADGSDAGPAANSRTEGNVAIQQTPGRLDALKWPLFGALLAMFAVGAFLLARKPVALAVPAGEAAAVGFSPVTAERPKSPVSAAPAAQAAMAELDSAANVSLDSLKERIFRLELRRQAGTISEEEYAQERASTEKILRDLVRG